MTTTGTIATISIPDHGPARVSIDSEPYDTAFGACVDITVLDGPWAGRELMEQVDHLIATI